VRRDSLLAESWDYSEAVYSVGSRDREKVDLKAGMKADLWTDSKG
jgi:hypothetical protein